jgi:hypothetical protein
MGLNRVARALAAGAVALVLTALGKAAFATDMSIKAPLPSPWVFDVHGHFDFTTVNTRVTGGGLLLYNTDSFVIQPGVDLSLEIYKNPANFINGFSLFGGVWNENITDPHGFQALFRHWQEMDWWIGVTFGFAQHWTFSAQHLEFLFPWDGTIFNDLFKLSLDDSYLGGPVALNPWIQMFYTERGGSAVILGRKSNIEHFAIGIAPAFVLMKSAGIPLTISLPTWIDFGPSGFWNRNDGTTNFCGPTSSAPCPLSDLGYFTTGLQANYTLESVIPKRLGTWNVHAGVQYYHIINDALLAAQIAGPAGVAPETSLVGTGVVQFYPQAKRDVAVLNGGFGFSF